jgi:cytoskeleton protein RodZ
MMEKTNSHKAKKKRDPLGKSFSEILLQSTSPKKTVFVIPEATTTKTVLENHAAGIMMRKELRSDNSKNSSNINMIGLVLKEKREEKGLTLDRMARDLCLKVSFLKSIEEGNWENMPHKVYARGYVRKYADLLGVYNEIIPYLTQEDQIQKNTEKPGTRGTRRPDEKLLSFLLSKKTPKAVFIYAVVIALTLSFFLVESKRKQGSEISKLENAVRVSNSTSENDTRKSAPAFADTKKLMITCHERTWISVIIDGTEKKEFTLKPQEVVILNATEKFDLLIGNAGGIRLILDGKDTSFTGENGQVKRVTLS